MLSHSPTETHPRRAPLPSSGTETNHPGPDPAGPVTVVHVVPFSHLDLFWTGTREECLSRGNLIIAEALRLLRKYEDFTFLIETVNFLEHYLRCYPEDLAEIREFAREGRLELAPLWSAIYQNLPGGETLARNALLAKRWVCEQIGCDPLTAHFGDLPGFTPQYPQIARQCGIRHVLMSRGGPRETPLFRWKGLDGTEVLSFFSVIGYATFGVATDWHKDYASMENGPTRQRLEKLLAGSEFPSAVHWGCDLYCPNENLVENVRMWNRRQDIALQFSTFDRYFAEAGRSAGLPVLTGELPSAWPNIESSWPDIWPLDLPCEHALHMAEFLASWCLLLGWPGYPAAPLRQAWISLLDGMDHNQNSQGGAVADRDKLQLKLRSRYEAERIRDEMAWKLASRVPVPKGAFPVVVFNAMSWQRTEIVTTRAAVFGTPRTSEIGDFADGMRIVDQDGRTVPYVVLNRQEGLSVAMDIALPAENIPALGYRSYYLVPGRNPIDDSLTCEIVRDAAVERDPRVTARHTAESLFQIGPRRAMGRDEFSNRFFRVVIDCVTGEIDIWDRRTERALFQRMRLAGVEERRGNYIFEMTASGREFPPVIDAIETIDNNAVWCRIRIRGSLHGMPFRQVLTLYPDRPEIGLENEIDWKEPRWVRMQQVFPHAGKQHTTTYGVPYGSVEYPGTMTGTLGKLGDEIDPKDRDRLRLCRHWVDIGGADEGVTIGCDHRMWEFDGGELRSYMLRGTGFCFAAKRLADGTLQNFERPPAGTYRFRYVLRPRHAELGQGAGYRCGWELNHPLLGVAVCGTNGRPTLPAAGGLLDLTDSSMVVTAVKKAEDGAGVVLRAFESAGRNSPFPAETMAGRVGVSTNILEETREPVTSAGPFEIKTVMYSGEASG